MENISAFEESLLAKSLANFWSTIARRREIPPVQFSDLAFFWESYIRDQNKYNAPAKLYVEDDINSLLLDAEGRIPGLKARDLRDQKLNEFIVRSGTYAVLDGAVSGDIPTLCTVDGLLPHELPVKGTFVHPRIVPGFAYNVRQLDNENPLFKGKALCLEKIGIGYGKRITFSGDELHDNDNYFWSDTNPEGYGFSLELVHVGDKFTILDVYENPIGTVEVDYLTGAQVETEKSIVSKNKLEKQADVSLRCKIKYFDDSMFSHDIVHVRGVAVSLKKSKSRSRAVVTKVRDCFISGQSVTLVPSTIKDIQKTKSLCGEESLKNVPSVGSVAGIYRNELSVIGTFVDPSIIPGFKYKVRLLNSKMHLFEGEALTLLAVGKGYGKRITFTGKSVKENDNYFYSDTNPEGYGFTLEAVSEGNSFKVVDSTGYVIGKARVFKLCGPQIEIKSEIKDQLCTKKVKVSLACHILLNEKSDGITTRVNGIAHVERKKGSSSVLRIESLEFVNLFNSQNCNLSAVNAFVKV